MKENQRGKKTLAIFIGHKKYDCAFGWKITLDSLTL